MVIFEWIIRIIIAVGVVIFFATSGDEHILEYLLIGGGILLGFALITDWIDLAIRRYHTKPPSHQ